MVLYPNPVIDRLFVQAKNLQKLEVYNAMGQLVATTTSESLDMIAFSEGIYFVRVVCESGIITKRVVKQ